MMNLAGRAFILVSYSEDVIIGTRGFLPEEKEKGLVLVFNHQMQFDWTGEGISGRLVFGSKTEKCLVPSDSIISVFSPELSAHFSTSELSRKRQEKSERLPDKNASREKVVKVDFGKKK